jgi:hypothetical protein
MKARVHFGARRRIRRLVNAWVREYPTPENPDDLVRADATKWARTVIDEVFDVAVERPLALPVWMTAFTMNVIVLTVANVTFGPLNAAETVVMVFLAVLTGISTIGLLAVTSPTSSKKLRTALAGRLIAGAVDGARRKRAFVVPQPAPVQEPDWRTAEKLAVEWMHHLGDTQMQLTRSGPDGGIDGESVRFVAQVKNWQRDLIGVDHVRALYGVATEQGKSPVFFTRRGYSTAALDFARRVDMPLFLLDPAHGRLSPANPAAQHLRRFGIHVPMAASAKAAALR